MRLIIRKRNCEQCKKDCTCLLMRNIIASGTSQAFWMCSECNKPAKSAAWISHESINGIGVNIQDIPINKNNSNLSPCVVCGEPGQFHHWMPRSYIQKYELESKWYEIGAYLCDYHHLEIWHAILTPGLVGNYARVAP